MSMRLLCQSNEWRSDIQSASTQCSKLTGARRRTIVTTALYVQRWGVETPASGWCRPKGTELLDLMVGEPVAYATGPRLKATGPSSTVSNSPITKIKGHSRGRTASYGPLGTRPSKRYSPTSRPVSRLRPRTSQSKRSGSFSRARRLLVQPSQRRSGRPAVDCRPISGSQLKPPLTTSRGPISKRTVQMGTAIASSSASSGLA